MSGKCAVDPRSEEDPGAAKPPVSEAGSPAEMQNAGGPPPFEKPDEVARPVE